MSEIKDYLEEWAEERVREYLNEVFDARRPSLAEMYRTLIAISEDPEPFAQEVKDELLNDARAAWKDVCEGMAARAEDAAISQAETDRGN